MRPPRFALAPLAAALLALSPAPRLAAQDAPPAAASVQAPAAPAEQSLRRSALPEPSAPPRTMRAYWHVFAAFTIAWLLLFGYVVSIGRRFRALEREVDSLRATS
jgi:CcmD family protein